MHDDSKEPVAWFTDDHLTDKSATTWDRTVAERWRAKGWPVQSLYAAPQTSEAVRQQRAGDAREALSWYAEQVADCRKFGSDGDAARQALDKDGGQRARAALSATQPEQGERDA